MTELDNKYRLIKEFTQKRGLNFRKFCLYQNKITVETKTIRKIEKYEVRIENLGLETLYQADNVLIGKIWFYICLVAPILVYILQFFPGQDLPTTNLVMLHIGFWFFALLNYLKQHQDDIILKGSNNLAFYRNIPNEQSVLKFIELVKLTTKQRLKLKYFKIDNYTDENELKQTMNWLLEQDIISNTEYKDVLSEYKLKNI
jgi:hypothetical protein